MLIEHGAFQVRDVVKGQEATAVGHAVLVDGEGASDDLQHQGGGTGDAAQEGEGGCVCGDQRYFFVRHPGHIQGGTERNTKERQRQGTRSGDSADEGSTHDMSGFPSGDVDGGGSGGQRFDAEGLLAQDQAVQQHDVGGESGQPQGALWTVEGEDAHGVSEGGVDALDLPPSQVPLGTPHPGVDEPVFGGHHQAKGDAATVRQHLDKLFEQTRGHDLQHRRGHLMGAFGL